MMEPYATISRHIGTLGNVVVVVSDISKTTVGMCGPSDAIILQFSWGFISYAKTAGTAVQQHTYLDSAVTEKSCWMPWLLSKTTKTRC